MASRSSVNGSGKVVSALLRWSPWVLSSAGLPSRTCTSTERTRIWLELVIAPYSAAMLTDVASSTE
jgi:hypothetical protein